jgi:hypothetical protein
MTGIDRTVTAIYERVAAGMTPEQAQAKTRRDEQISASRSLAQIAAAFDGVSDMRRANLLRRLRAYVRERHTYERQQMGIDLLADGLPVQNVAFADLAALILEMEPGHV